MNLFHKKTNEEKLEKALKHNNEKKVLKLLNENTNPNINVHRRVTCVHPVLPYNENMSALHYAAANLSKTAVEKLVEKGASLESQNYSLKVEKDYPGWMIPYQTKGVTNDITPSMVAAEQNKSENLKVLLQKGADINKVVDGKNAFDLCLNKGSYDSMTVIVQSAKADLSKYSFNLQKDEIGNKALLIKDNKTGFEKSIAAKSCENLLGALKERGFEFERTEKKSTFTNHGPSDRKADPKNISEAFKSKQSLSNQKTLAH